MQKIRQLFEAHPRLMAWLLLAIGMLIVFLITSASVPFTPAQRIITAGTVVALAGLCVWIIFWEE